MKKLNLAIVLAIGLVAPLTVMSSADKGIHKHAMERYENTTESVMKRVELPDVATDKVTDRTTLEQRFIKKSAGNAESKGKFLKKKLGGATEDHSGQGKGEGVGDLDRDRIQDQDMEQIHDMDQDRVMDKDQTQKDDLQIETESSEGNPADSGSQRSESAK